LSKPLSEHTDEELILAFQKDVMEAFDEIVARYKNPLMNFVYRFVGNYDDCSDIVQETFIRVFRNKHAYRTIAKFSTWIYTIAGNLAKTELRRRERRKSFSITDAGADEDKDFEIPDTAFSPDVQTDSVLKSKIIQDALNKIPTVYREVVILRDIQELSYEEISGITGLPIGTVKSRINRGRAQLQELLKDIYNE
jgi:RNA polymerase sigma-70 factor (ECF subfamily)